MKDEAEQPAEPAGLAGWGEAPDGDPIAELLRSRHRLEPGEGLTLAVDPNRPSLTLCLASRRHRYQLVVRYLRGAGKARDPWLLMADALDALLGSLLENGRDYRALPAGDDTEYEGAFFRVEIEHSVPELEKLADQLLSEN